MRAMILKHGKWMIWAGLGFAVLMAVAGLVATLILPGYVEKRLIPRLSDEFGLHPGDIEVRRIGLWGSDLGPIQFLEGDSQAMTISTVQIHYSPLSLIRGEIKGITIGGLGFRIVMSPDGASIAGVQMPERSTLAKQDPAELDLKRLLPIGLGRLVILQSSLTLEIQGRSYVIPFDVDFKTDQLENGRLNGRVRFSFFGNPMMLNVSMDQADDLTRLALQGTDVHLAALGPLLPEALAIQLNGVMDLDAKASFALRSFKLKHLALNGRLNNANIITPHGDLRPAIDRNGLAQPMVISVSGDRLSELRWHCAPFQVVGPASARVEGLSGGVTQSQGDWVIAANMKMVVPEQPLPNGIHLPASWPSNWQIAVRHQGGENQTQFEVSRSDSGPLDVTADDVQITAQPQAVSVSGSWKDGELAAKGVFTVNEIDIRMSNAALRIPTLRVDGSVGFPKTDADAAANVAANVAVPGVRATLEKTTVRLPEVTFQFAGRGPPRRPWQFDGRIKLANGRITDPLRKVRIRNVSVDLPLQWPATNKASPGRLRIGDVEWNRQDLGGIKGTLRQKKLGLTMALTHASKLFPGLRVLITGDIEKDGIASFEATVPRHHLAEAIDLGRFQPAAAGMMATGHVEAFVNVTFDGGRLAGDARFKFNQGRLHQPSRNLILEGVDMQVHIDDMDQIQSAPQQKLTVEQVTFGNLKAQHLSVDFQLEHPTTLFVEKAQIDWSEGKIHTASVRVKPGQNDYSVSLFCDRLNLAMVIEQLEAAKASGEGTVSGRIPIRWVDGRLYLDNGFLYSNSTPGQASTIQLSGTEVILAGLPPGTPQHTQVDIASEALKDYTYRWARLNLQTEDNILLLKLQFDGKPNRLLPFAYDQKLGQFKRVAGDGQADFKGISIDLNLKSPINEILNYKELLK